MGHGKGLLRYLVEVLYDSEKGLADLGDCLRDAEFATYFRHESEARGAYARRLEMSASLWDELDELSVVEALHYFWDFMAISKEESDHTLLMIAGEGEEVVMKAYQEALGCTLLSSVVRHLLEKQLTHVGMSHKLVQSFRVFRAA
jgi:uncharacterized protein (TIGR02284 family)